MFGKVERIHVALHKRQPVSIAAYSVIRCLNRRRRIVETSHMRASCVRYVLRDSACAAPQIENFVRFTYCQMRNQIIDGSHIGLAILCEILAKNTFAEL